MKHFRQLVSTLVILFALSSWAVENGRQCDINIIQAKEQVASSKASLRTAKQVSSKGLRSKDRVLADRYLYLAGQHLDRAKKSAIRADQSLRASGCGPERYDEIQVLDEQVSLIFGTLREWKQE